MSRPVQADGATGCEMEGLQQADHSVIAPRVGAIHISRSRLAGRLSGGLAAWPGSLGGGGGEGVAGEAGKVVVMVARARAPSPPRIGVDATGRSANRQAGYEA